jgi:hypothetical protein
MRAKHTPINFIVTLFLWWPVATIAYANEASDQFLLQALQEEEAAQGSFAPTSPMFDEAAKPPISRKVSAQIELIDQEIIILRAELAQSQNQVDQVRFYLNQLNGATVFPVFRARYLALLQSLSTPIYTPESTTPLSSPAPSISPKTVVIDVPGIFEEPSTIKSQSSDQPEPLSNTRFSVFNTDELSRFTIDHQNPSKVIAVLLPMSGEYELAGKQMWQGIQDSAKAQGVRAKLVLLDTEEFGSMWSLWQEAKQHNPILVLGPLRKESARDFQGLKTGVPTLFFNPVSPLTANERSLVPNRNSGLTRVLSVLAHEENQSVLVLSEDEALSGNLERAFHQAWLSEVSDGHYYHQTIQKKEVNSNVGQVLETGLNVTLSKNRAKVLENVLQESVQFKPRVRQDIGAVVSFLSHRQAAQAAPFLRFLGDSAIHHIWYPGQMPSMALLAGELKSWPKTYAVLPFYGVANVDLAIKELKSENSGLFYALGKTAVEMVKVNAFSPLEHSDEPAVLGAVRMAGKGQFQLLPALYWMDQGTFNPLTEALIYKLSVKHTSENEEQADTPN